MIHHLVEAAMLEINALIRHDPIGSAFQLTAHSDVRRLCAVIVDAGISFGIYPDAEVGLPWTRDEDAQVRCEQNIGVSAYDVIGFDGAAIERHHERAASRVVDGAVLCEVHAAGGTKPE
jgi:16S rRNA C1402 N4-methylase RsmH